MKVQLNAFDEQDSLNTFAAFISSCSPCILYSDPQTIQPSTLFRVRFSIGQMRMIYFFALLDFLLRNSPAFAEQLRLMSQLDLQKESYRI